MAEVRIAADVRTEFGKGGARRVRRSGRTPAVVYGHGTDPRHVSLPTRELMHALRTEAGLNVLLSLDLDGSTELALPKSLQRDPVRGSVEHVDLILVRRGEKVTVEVPVTLVGAPPPDAIVDQQAMTLAVEAEATHLPSALEVSIDGLPIGGSVTGAQVPLPAGVTLAGDPEQVVVHLLAEMSAEQFDAELAEAEAEVGAGAVIAAEEDEPAADEADESTGDVVPDTDSGAGGPGPAAGA